MKTGRVVGLALVMIVAVCSALLVAGCPTKSTTGAGPVATQPSTPAPAAGATAPSGPEIEGTVTVKGSDTMVHLVSQWAEAFMKVNPKADVQVTGGGSGTGIAALINGTTAVAAASRELKADEKKDLEAKGLTPTEFTVARDGIAVVLHPSNAINELTMDQLAKIYTGAATNWKQVGGSDLKIEVLSRESTSGTYAFFQEHVMKKKDYRKDARLMPATSAIIEAAAADKGAIGYVGLGYATGAAGRIKVLKVKKDDTAPAIEPSEATVKDGTYSVARPLFLVTAGEPTGAAKAFIDFCQSPDGQRIVKDAGYVTVE
jgi:phosphate transport system substrate-binding protein